MWLLFGEMVGERLGGPFGPGLGGPVGRGLDFLCECITVLPLGEARMERVRDEFTSRAVMEKVHCANVSQFWDFLCGQNHHSVSMYRSIVGWSFIVCECITVLRPRSEFCANVLQLCDRGPKRLQIDLQSVVLTSSGV